MSFCILETNLKNKKKSINILDFQINIKYIVTHKKSKQWTLKEIVKSTILAT